MTNLQRKLTLRHLLQLAAVVIAALCLACKVVMVTSPSDPEVPEILLCVASYIILYKFCLGVDLFITQVLPTMLLFSGPLWCILLAGVVHALHIAVTIDPPGRLREALALRLIEVALTIHITYVLRAFQPWPLLGLLGVAITTHWEDADLLCDVRQLFVCLGATCCDITLFVNAFGVAPVARRVRAAYVVSRLLVGMVLLLVSPQYVLTTAILLILYSTCQGWIVVVRPISVPLSEIKISDNKSHPADRCLLPFFEYQLRKRLAEEVEEIDTGLDAESDDEFEECVDPSVPFCIERFRERAELGKGEFGRCVWVFDVSSGREYALKYLNKSIYRRRGLTAKAAEELRIVSGISHQNVVTFYGAYETADTWAFVFEYCVHGDLAAYMSRNNPVNPVAALGMASRVLQAVNYLHELWIVYRDLKPANVVLDSNYDPKLCDFGLAIWRRSPDAKCRTFCGSAGYCAPEVRTGPEYDDKCDIFSWGALLWALVTGMQAHLHRSWPSTLSGTDAWFEGHLARFPPVDREGVREVLSMAAMANPTERPDSAFLCFGSPHVLRFTRSGSRAFDAQIDYPVEEVPVILAAGRAILADERIRFSEEELRGLPGPELHDGVFWMMRCLQRARLSSTIVNGLVQRVYDRVEFPKLGFPSTLDRKIKIQKTLHWKDVPDDGEYCKIIPLAYWTGLNLWLLFQRVSVDGYPFDNWLANDLLEWQYMLLDQWIRMAGVPTPSVGMETHRMERLLVGMSQTLDEASFALPRNFEGIHPTPENSPEELPVSVAGTLEVGPETYSDHVPLAMRLGMFYHSVWKTVFTGAHDLTALEKRRLYLTTIYLVKNRSMLWHMSPQQVCMAKWAWADV
ncbi:hypothetical protein FOZ62_024289 [Perkinsus olseni]|uniref:Protein kinase domain-containing protein n=2 Tax=Perkinsus olseni TaxID=32597 RepID=A0A7J6N6N1_PEROL|nr:hypothetical protein FOZ62_024289 [Perkinsus olseni]